MRILLLMIHFVAQDLHSKRVFTTVCVFQVYKDTEEIRNSVFGAEFGILRFFSFGLLFFKALKVALKVSRQMPGEISEVKKNGTTEMGFPVCGWGNFSVLHIIKRSRTHLSPLCVCVYTAAVSLA